MRVSIMLEAYYPCRLLSRLAGTDPAVLQDKATAAAAAAEAAEKTNRRLENPRITLIIETAEDVGEAFRERRRR